LDWDGSDIEVLEPADVRQRMREIVERALERFMK
jgi:predicted DNA-binding transcriptional regulator YafY